MFGIVNKIAAKEVKKSFKKEDGSQEEKHGIICY